MTFFFNKLNVSQSACSKPENGSSTQIVQIKTPLLVVIAHSSHAMREDINMLFYICFGQICWVTCGKNGSVCVRDKWKHSYKDADSSCALQLCCNSPYSSVRASVDTPQTLHTLFSSSHPHTTFDVWCVTHQVCIHVALLHSV